MIEIEYYIKTTSIVSLLFHLNYIYCLTGTKQKRNICNGKNVSNLLAKTQNEERQQLELLVIQATDTQTPCEQEIKCDDDMNCYSYFVYSVFEQIQSSFLVYFTKRLADNDEPQNNTLATLTSDICFEVFGTKLFLICFHLHIARLRSNGYNDLLFRVLFSFHSLLSLVATLFMLKRLFQNIYISFMNTLIEFPSSAS